MSGSPQQLSPMQQFLIDITSAFLSSSISKTISCPIENVKIVMQTHQQHQQDNFLQVAERIYKYQGVQGFFRGNLSNILRYIPTQMINFSFKSHFKSFIRPRANATYAEYLLLNVASGTYAGAISLLMVYPLDTVRTLLAADAGSPSKQYSGTIDCIQKTVQKSGISGLYAGFGVSVLGIAVYRATYFGLYDLTQKYIIQKSSFLKRFLLANCVTIAAGLLTYPLDTIRRRSIVAAATTQQQYSGELDCAMKIAKEEGFSAFFAGALTNIVRGLSGAIVLVVYDSITNNN